MPSFIPLRARAISAFFCAILSNISGVGSDFIIQADAVILLKGDDDYN
jgi:hypothetical protein